MIHESEFFVKGIFIQIDYNSTQVTDVQIRQLLRTLDLLPPGHLRQIPTITVGDRPPRGGGGSAHRGMPGGPYIRLNRTCFHSAWNRFHNYTLLHETGHIVDWAFHCMTHMRGSDRTGYNALLQHPHSGATQGPGEHFADGYADYYSGKRMSAARRNAIENSRAFHHQL